MLSVVPARGVGAGIGSRSLRFRALRHLASDFSVGPLTVSAWHPQVQGLSATCDNLSLHGLCIRIAGAGAGLSLLQVDDRLTGLHVTLPTGEVVCHGDATVRHVRPEGPDLLVGLCVSGGVVDLPLLHERQTRNRFAVRVEEAERAADTGRILPEFKAWIADLRTYLESMQGFLDREEAALGQEDLYTREQMCGQYIAEIAPRIIERVHQASHRMGAILGGLTEEEHTFHRAYGQQHMGAILGTSPFMRRVLQKPLGYAGDYEMMNMLYRAPEEGASLFGKVMNLCAVREVAARANVNRVGYLMDKLRGAVAAPGRRGPRVQLASIGCGPAREIDMLLEREPAFGPHLDVMLIDQDVRSISYCERKLTPVAHATTARLHFIRESIRRLLTGGSLATTLGPRDLIYSAGLFDYLSERSFTTLLGALYDAIVPGGQLLIGNVDVSNPTRYFMEYFGEWFLIHRSSAQLLDKARLLRPAPRKVWVESEPLGVNLFLNIEK